MDDLITVRSLSFSDADTPPRLRGAALLAGLPAQRVQTLGAVALLRPPLLALFCSVRCPASVILRLHDAVRALREAGAPVVSGFHSPVERECLHLLLRGSQPIVVCAARPLSAARLAPEWRAALLAGRLLIISPFDDASPYPDQRRAEARNHFAAALAEAALFGHIEPRGKTEALARAALAWGAPCATTDDPGEAMRAWGMTAVRADTCVDWWRGVGPQERLPEH